MGMEAGVCIQRTDSLLFRGEMPELGAVDG